MPPSLLMPVASGAFGLLLQLVGGLDYDYQNHRESLKDEESLKGILFPNFSLSGLHP